MYDDVVFIPGNMKLAKKPSIFLRTYFFLLLAIKVTQIDGPTQIRYIDVTTFDVQLQPNNFIEVLADNLMLLHQNTSCIQLHPRKRFSKRLLTPIRPI